MMLRFILSVDKVVEGLSELLLRAVKSHFEQVDSQICSIPCVRDSGGSGSFISAQTEHFPLRTNVKTYYRIMCKDAKKI